MHNQQLKDGSPYRVEHYELHPNFKNYSAYDDYDMAIVTVQGQIKFNQNVQTICLTLPNTDLTNEMMIVAGVLKIILNFFY